MGGLGVSQFVPFILQYVLQHRCYIIAYVIVDSLFMRGGIDRDILAAFIANIEHRKHWRGRSVHTVQHHSGDILLHQCSCLCRG